MSTLAPPQTNAFQETLLGMAYLDSREQVDLFSRACVEQYEGFTISQYGYRLSQVFEPNVLREVAILANLPYEQVECLAHCPSEATTRLAELVANRDQLSVIGLVNLATALISISRFTLATTVLVEASSRMPTPLGRFEVAMLEFIVANRRDTGIGSAGAFDQMREAIVAGGIPSHRALDACTQAVVWFLKRREISRELFEWYARLGHSLVHQDSQLGSAAVSAWYRAVAMSPAARGDAATTRRFMERARAAADQTVASRQYPYELHLVKTYHESSIKEHMYVTCDIDRAVASAEELIAMDPIWAPSHGELGDVYMRFGQPERAAQEYDRAAELGPPYYGHHILQAARAYAAAGEVDVAIARYRRLAELVPDDAKLLAAALRLAHSHSREDQAYFERALDRLEKSAASVGPAS